MSLGGGALTARLRHVYGAFEARLRRVCAAIIESIPGTTEGGRMSRERIGLMAILVFATAIPIPVLAQDGVVVEGRVFEFGSTSVIFNARVELEGHGATLTSVVGTFRFEDVEPGEYTLRVDAFGYASESRVLTVDSATTVLVPLQIAPLPLDSLGVELREIDIEGRVRDPERDLLLMDAEILTNQIEGTWTDAHGRFKLEDVLAEVPLRVIVRAFGYLAVDTILLPDEDEDYVFEVEPDPWVERMIEEQVERLDERSVGVRAVFMPPMDRERLLRYAGTFTLLDALEVEYRERRIDQIACVFIDERQEYVPVDVLLQTTLPEELERVELLFDGRMLRIYTREFMQYMFDLELELRAPILIDVLGGSPTCF